MAIGCITRGICDVAILQKPLQALAVVVVAGRVEAAEPVEATEPAYCVLDSECPRGKCIDLVCVDTEPAEGVAPAAPSSPSSPASFPRASGAPDQKAPIAPPAQATGEWESSEPDALATPEEASFLGDRGRPKKAWYGAPLIGTYAATGVVSGYAIATNEPALLLAVFSSPIVHWIQRKGGKGVLSLFMQPVFAGVGAAVFRGMCDPDGHDCESETIAGAVVGFAGWAAIDIAAIAYKSPEGFPRVAVAPFRTESGMGAEVFGVW